MKNHFPIALVAVFAVLVACTENEEPVNPLIGTWENREFVDSLDVWLVETIEIKSDNVFEQYITVRQTEKGVNLGYRSLSQGLYSKVGIELDLRFMNDFNYRNALNVDDLFAPKEELRQIEIFRIFSSARVHLVSNHKELEYQIICDEPFIGSASCEETRKFTKVY